VSGVKNTGVMEKGESMSSFDGANIFDSGPHRFFVGARGEQLRAVADLTGDPTQPGEQAIGPRDAEVIVRGRLVAATNQEMSEMLGAVYAKLASPPVVGELEDSHETVYSGMSFVSFTPEGPMDRGASVSRRYVARFVRFGGWA
jgi:hypothetical protein